MWSSSLIGLVSCGAFILFCLLLLYSHHRYIFNSGENLFLEFHKEFLRNAEKGILLDTPEEYREWSKQRYYHYKGKFMSLEDARHEAMREYAKIINNSSEQEITGEYRKSPKRETLMGVRAFSYDEPMKG